VYAFILNPNPSSAVTLAGVDAESVPSARLVGADEKATLESRGRDLAIHLPDRLPHPAAITLDLGTGARLTD